MVRKHGFQLRSSKPHLQATLLLAVLRTSRARPATLHVAMASDAAAGWHARFHNDSAHEECMNPSRYPDAPWFWSTMSTILATKLI